VDVGAPIVRLGNWSWVDVYVACGREDPDKFAAATVEQNQKRYASCPQSEILVRGTGRSTRTRAAAVAFALNGGRALIDAATRLQADVQVELARAELDRIAPHLPRERILAAYTRRRDGRYDLAWKLQLATAVFPDHSNP